jgi:bifunctional non-homologous end joining protein LigD
MIEGLPFKSAVLDGEIIALDAQGQVSFNVLAHRMHVVGASKIEGLSTKTPVTYQVFDILYLDGRRIMDLPYSERRALLDELGLAGPAWSTPPSYPGAGEALLECAREHQIEGIVAKRLDSHYEPGKRSGAWLKIKLVHRQEFVIGGWTPYRETDESRIGSLLLGYYEQLPDADEQESPKLRYVGSVGTGFSDADRVALAKLLKARARQTNPFDRPTKPALYAEPELVGEIEFRGWVGTDMLRQSSFQGLRTDKDPREVVREDKGLR